MKQMRMRWRDWALVILENNSQRFGGLKGTLESWWCRRLVSNGTASMTNSDASDGSFLQILAAVDNATL
jgi:hypothetical protein